MLPGMDDPRVFAAFELVWRQEVDLLTALLADIEADRPRHPYPDQPARAARFQANRDRFFAAVAEQVSAHE